MACQCPVCQIPLTPRVFDAACFEECGKCGGVWMLRETLERIESKDVDELEVIDNMVRPTRIEIAATSVKACPSCGRGMERFHFLVDSPVELDCCNSCGGLWIEDGELAQMAALLERDANPPTTEELAVIHNALKNAEADELLAQYGREHNQIIARYRAINSLGNMLSRRRWPYDRHF